MVVIVENRTALLICVILNLKLKERFMDHASTFTFIKSDTENICGRHFAAII